MAENDLLKLLHDTKAVSIWNQKTGPVFWYAASVPGPFYVNTELVIGPALAEKLLKAITDIVAASKDPAVRAAKLNETILKEYQNSAAYRQVIAAMVAKARPEFPAGSYDLVSGGERRDWLFSIPFAHEMDIKHAFLFKDGALYCKEGVSVGEKALHVADLINNAASYFDLWFPILDKNKLKCAGTLCVNTRGSNGVTRLKEHACKLVTLNAVDTGFFEKSATSGIIGKEVLAEIETYFASPKEWAAKYLFRDTGLFDVERLDAKSFERLKSFFANDPWSLKASYGDFFASIEKEIRKRQGA